MKKLGFLGLLLLLFLPSWAQVLNLLHQVHFPIVISNLGNEIGTSDCWGYTDAHGVDYGIVGNSDHVAFVRASDGVVLDTVQLASDAAGMFPRDFKTKGHYCYAVTDLVGIREGLAVIDLQYLPDSVHFVGAFDEGGSFRGSHNLHCDQGRPYAYAIGYDGQVAGIDIFNISDPENPFLEGFLEVGGSHDMFSRNDTLWVAGGLESGFSIYDVTDKGNPILLAQVVDSTARYCHNIWPSEDGKFFFTTEESLNKTVKIWDASDFNHIVMRGQYLANNGLAHNVHVKGNLLYISHYTSGLRIVDWSDPDMPAEVAAYDTYPLNDVAGFQGCWGTFPYTADGYVYASNIEGRLDFFKYVVPLAAEAPELAKGNGHAWPNPMTTVTNIPLVLARATEVSVRG